MGTDGVEDVTSDPVVERKAGGGCSSIGVDCIEEEEVMTEEVFLLLSLRSWNRLILGLSLMSQDSWSKLAITSACSVRRDPGSPIASRTGRAGRVRADLQQVVVVAAVVLCRSVEAGSAARQGKR